MSQTLSKFNYIVGSYHRLLFYIVVEAKDTVTKVTNHLGNGSRVCCIEA